MCGFKKLPGCYLGEVDTKKIPTHLVLSGTRSCLTPPFSVEARARRAMEGLKEGMLIYGTYLGITSFNWLMWFDSLSLLATGGLPFSFLFFVWWGWLPRVLRQGTVIGLAILRNRKPKSRIFWRSHPLRWLVLKVIAIVVIWPGRFMFCRAIAVSLLRVPGGILIKHQALSHCRIVAWQQNAVSIEAPVAKCQAMIRTMIEHEVRSFRGRGAVMVAKLMGRRLGGARFPNPPEWPSRREGSRRPVSAAAPGRKVPENFGVATP